MANEPDLRIPSINDPFDLIGCSELPFPLNEAEDIILKHILGICASDYQMAKRAYDSIICMWSKNLIRWMPIPPILLAIDSPADPLVLSNMGQAVEFRVSGRNFDSTSMIYYNGKVVYPTVMIDSEHLTGVVNYSDPILPGPAFIAVYNGSSQMLSGSAVINVSGGIIDNPVLHTITPPSHDVGPSGGSVTVSVSGSGFKTGAKIYYKGLVATDFAYPDAISITARLDFPVPFTAGLIPIQVVNPDGKISNTIFFNIAGPVVTIPPSTPSISSISPDTINTFPDNWINITINGTDFDASPTVYFGGVAATNVVVVSPTQITCSIYIPRPSSSGSVPIQVVNGSGLASNVFTITTIIQQIPVIVSADPSSFTFIRWDDEIMYATGHTVLTINNFIPVNGIIYVNGQPTTFYDEGPNRYGIDITYNVPGGTASVMASIPPGYNSETIYIPGTFQNPPTE